MSFRQKAQPGGGSERSGLCPDALAGMAGLEPTISESKSGVLPLHYIPPSKLCAKRPVSRPLVRVGWEMGLEPTTPGTTIRCSYQLSYTHHCMEPANGTPGGTRTPGLLLRRQLLYPAELLARILAHHQSDGVCGYFAAGALSQTYRHVSARCRQKLD